MKGRLENVYGTALSATLKVVNPLKKSIISTNCEVHIFIQSNSLEILNKQGYCEEYNFFKVFLSHINRGLVWADQDFKSYHHFYDPRKEKGKFGYEENAMTLAKSYYNRALKFYKIKDYKKSMFYLGAACHIVQDLTIPQHAKGKLLDNHRQFEVYVKANYKKVKPFKSNGTPIVFKSIDDYITYNSIAALNTDYMYSNVRDTTTKFYITAIKCITLAQRSTAGCMLMFYNDLNYI